MTFVLFLLTIFLKNPRKKREKIVGKTVGIMTFLLKSQKSLEIIKKICYNA